jgi:anaerobic selenocysteine-containing dehydrogenase
VQGASDVGGIPMFYTDYQSVKDRAVRHLFAETWGVPDERLPLEPGLKVTQIVKEGSPVRGMYIMVENPIISDPDVSHAEQWFRELEFLAVQDLFLTETARYADKLNVYHEDLRRLLAKSYWHGRKDAVEHAEAAARDKMLIVGVICAAVGFAAGLGAAGLLS